VEAVLDGFRLKLAKRTDKFGKNYYYCKTNAPMMLDLSDSVVFVFPDVDAEEATLVVKYYEPQERRDD
jgi:hypothetical protein